jgi:hypothetical protein
MKSTRKFFPAMICEANLLLQRLPLALTELTLPTSHMTSEPLNFTTIHPRLLAGRDFLSNQSSETVSKMSKARREPLSI